MKDIYDEMMAVSLQIALSFPEPRFYIECREALDFVHSLYDKDPQVLRCRIILLNELKDDLGHGMDHSGKVALEAGALAYIEGKGGSLGESSILKELSIAPEKDEYIVQAIANHEAFVEPQKIDSPVGQMISNALYDADKFRWGPDNFTQTLWQMLRSSEVSIVPLIHRFPKGMEGIAAIKETFRTETGKIYGPEFIELGLQIGEKIYQFLLERFAEELQGEKKE
jgi:hypothetical protein